MTICHVIQIKFNQLVSEKSPHNYQPTGKAYLSDNRVANTFKRFTHKMAAKTSWHRCGTKLRHCQPTYIARWRTIAHIKGTNRTHIKLPK